VFLGFSFKPHPNELGESRLSREKFVLGPGAQPVPELMKGRHEPECVVGSDFIRRDPDGEVTLDTRQLPLTDKPTPNVPTWQPPLPPHSVENIGSTEFNAMQVEIKDAG